MTKPFPTPNDKLVSLKRINKVIDVYIKTYSEHSIGNMDSNDVINLFEHLKGEVNNLSFEEKALNEKGGKKI